MGFCEGLKFAYLTRKENGMSLLNTNVIIVFVILFAAVIMFSMGKIRNDVASIFLLFGS